MRIVLDTNVWLSAIFWEGEASRIIETCEKNNIEIIITENIILEIVDVLNKEAKFQRFIKEKNQDIEELIKVILSKTILIQSKTKLNLIKEDPKNNMILEAALDGKANYIISYDNHVLNMIEFRKIKILSPEDFLKEL